MGYVTSLYTFGRFPTEQLEVEDWACAELISCIWHCFKSSHSLFCILHSAASVNHMQNQLHIPSTFSIQYILFSACFACLQAATAELKNQSKHVVVASHCFVSGFRFLSCCLLFCLA